MKATLGIGFEDRSPALDFNIALAEARKVLGIDGTARGTQAKNDAVQEVQQDFSLKEGEKIHIQLGRRSKAVPSTNSLAKTNDSAALFSIAPPPSAANSHSDQPATASPPTLHGKTAQELGFDDGEFGEFQ